MRLPNGDTFELEFCESECLGAGDHVWMKFPWAGRYKEGEDTFQPPDDELDDDDDEERTIPEQDRAGPYDISIMVYYTRQFKTRRPDVTGFIDQVKKLY